MSWSGLYGNYAFMTPQKPVGFFKVEVPMIQFKCVDNQVVTSPYGLRTHPVTHQKGVMHYGVDVVSKSGDRKIKSPLAGGVIIEIGSDTISGNWIKVLYPGDLVVSFCHLTKKGNTTLMGYKLKKDEWFCNMGKSGRSSGVHLHLTFRLKGAIVNPSNHGYTF